MQENHTRFADKYFETLNAKESAIYAGFSEDTAKQIGYNLLQRDDIQEYLNKLREEASEKHGITKEKWLSELAEIGFSNILDFMSEGNNFRDITDVQRDKTRVISSVKKTITEFEGGEKTVTEFKLHDKLNALEKIGRHFDFYSKDSSQKPIINVPAPIIYNNAPPIASNENEVDQ